MIGPNSLLIGQAAGRLFLHDRFNVNLLAVSRSGQRFTERLRDIELRAGDVIVLQGVLATHAGAAAQARLPAAGCAPAPPRQRAPRADPDRRARCGDGARRHGYASVGIAFFGAGVLTILLGSLTLREAYEPSSGRS